MGSCRCCATNREEVDTTIFGLDGSQNLELADSIKDDQITERDFLENSKTGDLLLYTTHGFFPRVTRGATNSNYDHVAMVVKSINKSDPQNQVYIFESVN